MITYKYKNRIKSFDKSLFRHLDISFNRLKKIEGLETLTKLRKLYLPQNRFTKMENVGHLEELVMLELGANKLRVTKNQ